MKLSVIVCVYNTPEKYLEECLDSVVNSTLDKTEYEILLIDDGSSYDYSDFTNRYPARIIKTENRGILHARLLGIEEARGEYITFVDSDDTVSFNYHFPMLKYAEEENIDIVLNDWAFHTERTRYVCLADSTISQDFLSTGDDILLAFFKNEGREHSYFVLWNKLFRREIFINSLEKLNFIAQEEKPYNFSEDALISFFAFKSAKKCANLHTGYYFYRIHSEQTVNIIDSDRLKSHIICMSKTLDIMNASISENSHRDEISASIKKWALLMSRTHYSYAKANKYCHLYELIKERYHTDSLRKSYWYDSSAYSKNRVLPYNILEIEDALLTVYKKERCILPSGRENTYMNKSLEYMRSLGIAITKSEHGYPLPIPKTKLKDQILMHKLVYTLGLIFFKKGSKIRAFLKKHI